MRLCTKKLSYKLRWAACLIPSVMPTVETSSLNSSFTAAGAGQPLWLRIQFLWLAYLLQSVLTSQTLILADIQFTVFSNFFFFFLNHLQKRDRSRDALTITHHVSTRQVQVICSADSGPSVREHFLQHYFRLSKNNRRVSSCQKVFQRPDSFF